MEAAVVSWAGWSPAGLAALTAGGSPLSLAGGGDVLLGIAARGAVLLLTVGLCIAVHEAGHVLAGLSQRFSLVLWAAGPLWLSREGGRLRLRLNRTPALWGGLAVTVPRRPDDVVRRFAVAVAGGPVASLLLVVTGGVLWWWLPASCALTRFGAACAGILSGLILLVTLQPFGAGGGFYSDGGRLLRLLRGGDAAAQEAGVLTLYAAAASGQRPRDWPHGAMAAAASMADGGPFEAAVCVMGSQYALDRGEVWKADAFLQQALRLWGSLPDLVRAAVAAEAAFYFAWVCNEPGRARELLRFARGPFVEPHRVLRAEAAVRLAEGDRQAAGEAARRAISALERPLVEGNAFDRELIEAILARSREV